MKDTNFALNRAFLMGSAVLSLLLPSPGSLAVHQDRDPLPVSRPAVHGGGGLGRPIGARHGAQRPSFSRSTPPAPRLFLLLFLVRIGRLALMAGRCGCERHRGLKVVLCGRAGESFSFFNFVFLNRANIPRETSTGSWPTSWPMSGSSIPSISSYRKY